MFACSFKTLASALRCSSELTSIPILFPGCFPSSAPAGSLRLSPSDFQPPVSTLFCFQGPIFPVAVRTTTHSFVALSNGDFYILANRHRFVNIFFSGIFFLTDSFFNPALCNVLQYIRSPRIEVCRPDESHPNTIPLPCQHGFDYQ